jgi:hypothetical protein
VGLRIWCGRAVMVQIFRFGEFFCSLYHDLGGVGSFYF